MDGFEHGADMSRVLIAANRLPVTATLGPDGIAFAPSSGGLATALGRIHQARGGLWIGSPGIASDQLDGAGWDDLVETLGRDRLIPIAISGEESQRFYDGFSNSFIWPILHSFTGRQPADTDDWETYRAINQRFADAIVAWYRPGDQIWIHDFHLFLVPEMLRAALPDAAIGFFLHVPFPTADVFRTLPGRSEMLRGLLGSTLIGFHTASYLRFFASAVAEILDLPTEIDRIVLDDREVRLGVFPIGIDARDFEAVAAEPVVDELVREIRGDGSARIMVAVDRMDYTKGIPRRLLAFERLLARYPELHERVRLVNLAVPTREAVPAYQDFRQEVDRLVGRINGRFSTPRWTPIHYLFRSVDRQGLAALYRAADVMLVTPIRDGMNLVAKEFAASRIDGDGVLVLSEFAGAAADLPEALIINPYEVDQVATRLAEALEMAEPERRRRMAGLRERVIRYDGDWWAASFLDALAAGARADARRPVRLGTGGLELALARFRAARRRVFLLDYDGTLTPIVERPELALPDDELLALLRALAADRRQEVHVVSGRSRGFLDRWLGGLPIHLHAEHGAARRRPGAKSWERLDLALPWLDRVRGVFDDFARVTPGASVETKEYGLCWHWRQADATASRSATELALHLGQVLHRSGAEVLVGHRIVEVRSQGVNKAKVARAVAQEAGPSALVLAAGDDSTDEDLFRGLPPGAIAVRIGAGPTMAGYRLADVGALRGVLHRLAGSAGQAATA